jgi:hypothetical protein
MAAQLAQTIAIFDKSGKAISTSKQLKNVFLEAKSAYRERKAEIRAEREAKEQHELRKAIKAMSVAEESRTEGSRHRRTGSHGPDPRMRPPTGERGYSGSSVRSGTSSASRSPSQRHPHTPRPAPTHIPPRLQEDVYGASRSAPASPDGHGKSRELVRSHTDMDLALPARRPRTPVRSHSAGAIDMDLAYGEFHPESLGATVPYTAPEKQQQELGSLVTKAKMLLDEAHCAHHSVKAIIVHLQKNPDAMAAVALTLAEISNVVSKMAPGALTAIKAGAPSVFALLAAPEFLIAVGVGLGITVVMFGGYKIIKKIKAKNAEKDDGVDEMLEIGQDVNRIEHWRRGIADAATHVGDDDVASVATSVEAEFITPIAAASMGHLPVDPKMREVKEGRKSSKKDSKKERTREKSERSSSKASSKGPGTHLASGSERGDRAVIKVKKPSPLRRMFHRDDGSSTRS